MFGDDQKNWSVFELLDDAFIVMSKISYNLHQNPQKASSAMLYDDFIYNTVVWGMYVLSLFVLSM